MIKSIVISEEVKYGENGQRIFEIDKEATNKLNDLKQKAIEKLKRRYERCDSKGHKIPDYFLNKCRYCYRTLKYSDSTQEILKKRKTLPMGLQLFDALILDKNRVDSRRLQEKKDYDNGIKALIKPYEKNKKGLLKRIFH